MFKISAKKTALLSALFTSVGIGLLSCGGGGGGYTSSTSLPQVSEVEKVATAVGVKEVPLDNETTAIVAPEKEVIILDDRYAYTRSDTGVALLLEFPPQPTLVPSNDTVDNANILLENLKPIKKIIRSSDEKVAIYIDKINLDKDLSISITNYKKLIALINNGFDILEKGYWPLPDYSIDIAFYTPDNKRILDLEKFFKGQSFEIYPFLVDKTDGVLKEGNYTIFRYDYEGNLVDTETVTLQQTTKEGVFTTDKPIMSVSDNGVKIGPVIFAKSTNLSPTTGEVNGLPISAVGLIVLMDDKDNTIGIAKIENGSYQGFYQTDKTIKKAKVISAYLKEPVIVEDYQINGTISIAEDKLDVKLWNPQSVTDLDKLILGRIATVYKSYIDFVPTEDFKSLLFIENLYDNEWGFPTELTTKYYQIVSEFLNNPLEKPESLDNGTYIASSEYENCTMNIAYSSKTLKIKTECTGYSTYAYADYITISYAGNTTEGDEFHITSSSFLEESYDSNCQWSTAYTLLLNNEDRKIIGYKEKGTCKDNSKLYKEENGTIEPIGEVLDKQSYVRTITSISSRLYKIVESGSASETVNSNDGKYGYTISGNYKLLVPIKVSLENSTVEVESLKNVTLGLSNIKVTSKPVSVSKEDLTITDKLIVMSYINETVYANGMPITEYYVSAKDILTYIETLVNITDEPTIPEAKIIITEYLKGQTGGTVGFKAEVILPEGVTCEDCTYYWDLDNNGYVDGKVGTNTVTAYFGNSEALSGTATVYIVDAEGKCVAKGSVNYNLSGDPLASPPTTSLDYVEPKEDSTEPVPGCE